MAATSRQMVSAAPTLVAPNWAGDCLGREFLMPAGSKVDNTLFGSADSTGAILIPSGTIVGRTYAQRDSNTPLHPAASTDNEFFIVAFDVVNALINDDVELARPYAGLVVKENFLPGTFTGLNATVISSIRARYVCINGVS